METTQKQNKRKSKHLRLFAKLSVHIELKRINETIQDKLKTIDKNKITDFELDHLSYWTRIYQIFSWTSNSKYIYQLIMA